MDDQLNALDARFGPVAVLSLTQRGLIPEPGVGPAATVAGEHLANRVAGALVGAACGSALGLPYEWRRRRINATDPRSGARFAADVEMLARSLELQLDLDLGSAPALADWLTREPRLHNPGNAIPAVIDRLLAGTPWFEAGVGSFGNGALLRAVGAGIVYRDRPDWRPIATALDTIVTHATNDAVAVATTLTEAITFLLQQEDHAPDPFAVLDHLLALAPTDDIDDALRVVRRRVEQRRPLSNRADALGSLAAALYWSLTHMNRPEAAIRAAVNAGGDTDTVGALVGALTGAASGLNAIPARWVQNVRDVDPLIAVATRIAGVAPRVRPAEPTPEPGDESAGVHINFLLDRSGSMQQLKSDVVGAYDNFVASQQAGSAECAFTLVQFDSEDPCEVLVDEADIRAVPKLDPDQYQPRSMTPLYDAIGLLLDHAESLAADRRHHSMPAHDQLVVVFTDGLENASRVWTQRAIFERVADLKAKGWTFVFLGANQDSYASGRDMGLAEGSVSNFEASGDGVKRAFSSMDRAVGSYRGKRRQDRHNSRDDFFEGIKEAERS